eukprot:m.12070 g.12070  ORF g.12070 m.12070 type:complete len:84 (+) comp7949_c0_seq2:101-352(+)
MCTHQVEEEPSFLWEKDHFLESLIASKRSPQSCASVSTRSCSSLILICHCCVNLSFSSAGRSFTSASYSACTSRTISAASSAS